MSATRYRDPSRCYASEARDDYQAPTVPDDANARLIAAAPELLAVLQELEESSSYWSDYDVPVGIVDRIKAAIARATGKEPA